MALPAFPATITPTAQTAGRLYFVWWNGTSFSQGVVPPGAANKYEYERDVSKFGDRLGRDQGIRIYDGDTGVAVIGVDREADGTVRHWYSKPDPSWTKLP